MAIKNIAKIYSAELEGVNARLIEVETDMNVGLHEFSIVGLADKALNEAKERINSALKNSGIKPPNKENRKITVNLAPAEVKKTGSHYDLAMALGYLLASKQIGEFETDNKIFLGELALDGRLRPINGALNIAEMAMSLGFEFVFLPTENANEASVVGDISIIGIKTLSEAIEILEKRTTAVPTCFKKLIKKNSSAPDFSEIKGQDNAKRALMIAAAGAHNMLMIGPPGVGKSLLAQALIGILPDAQLFEAIETTKVWSAAGMNTGGLISERPFRAPHQTASVVALIGGGTDPRPGEISLAHRGILFLDEVPEFQKNALEALRQPMESGYVHVSRAKKRLTFPARFTLVAAMNPCPCGYYGDSEQACRCTPYEVIKYQKKISGPLLDRIDLQVKVGRVTMEELRTQKEGGLISPNIKIRIEAARKAQQTRFAKMDAARRIIVNAEMSSRQAELLSKLDPATEKFLAALGKAHLSPRSYYRLLKVARTIADLEAEEFVSEQHLAEAFSYRLKEES